MSAELALDLSKYFGALIPLKFVFQSWKLHQKGEGLALFAQNFNEKIFILPPK